MCECKRFSAGALDEPHTLDFTCTRTRGTTVASCTNYDDGMDLSLFQASQPPLNFSHPLGDRNRRRATREANAAVKEALQRQASRRRERRSGRHIYQTSRDPSGFERQRRGRAFERASPTESCRCHRSYIPQDTDPPGTDPRSYPLYRLRCVYVFDLRLQKRKLAHAGLWLSAAMRAGEVGILVRRLSFFGTCQHPLATIIAGPSCARYDKIGPPRESIFIENKDPRSICIKYDVLNMDSP